MAEDHIEALRKARENFVRKRRAMAEQMVPLGAAAAHFAPSFADLQAVIEAIDRAIADEEIQQGTRPTRKRSHRRLPDRTLSTLISTPLRRRDPS